MESIFDFNPTERERYVITGFTREDMAWVDDDSKARGVAMLFFLRGNKRMMRKYLKRISDVNMRNSFMRTISHLSF